MTSISAISGDFDLNIEKVLESWSTSHAIRELIANALDECALTGTSPVIIDRQSLGRWVIRDFGRGIRHTHLTQNESPEKREHESIVIGRFGVGLKDALAVLDRRKGRVVLRSRHGKIELVHREKVGFPDVRTLHARVSPSDEPAMRGTEVILAGITNEDVETARGFFLRFSDESTLETTRFGAILRRHPDRPARIYVKGLVVAEEPNFAFSYNITSLTEQMRRALNRERTNVGRTAYSERVKTILLAAESTSVAEILAEDLSRVAEGTSCDEVRQWSDVGLRASQVLNAGGKVVFVTAEELISDRELVDRAISDGLRVITVPNALRDKLDGATDTNGNPLQSLDEFQRSWSASLTFDFIPREKLSERERSTFDQWKRIAEFDGGLPRQVKEVLISETMRPSVHEGFSPAGLWEPDTGRIIIKRDQLHDPASFAGTLLHEIAHARTGHSDVSRDFEVALTRTIGRLAHQLATTERVAEVAPPASQPVIATDAISSTNVEEAGAEVIARIVKVVQMVSSQEELEGALAQISREFADKFTISLRPPALLSLFRAVRELALAEIAMGARITKRASVSFDWPPVFAVQVVIALASGLKQRARDQSGPLRMMLARLADECERLRVEPAQLARADAFLPASRIVAELHDLL